MNTTEVAQILAVFQAAYPTAEFSPETAKLWASRLVGIDAVDGRNAANALIDSSKFCPSIAEYREQCRAETRIRTGNQEGRIDAPELTEETPSTASIGRDHVLDLIHQTKQHIAAIGGRDHWHGGPEPCPVCGGINPNLKPGESIRRQSEKDRRRNP